MGDPHLYTQQAYQHFLIVEIKKNTRLQQENLLDQTAENNLQNF